MEKKTTNSTGRYGTYHATNFDRIRLPRPLQRLRESLTQREKMTMLMVLGFTFVFSMISLFAIRQIEQIMYEIPEKRIARAFESPTHANDVLPAPVMEYSKGLKSLLQIEKQDTIVLREFKGDWWFFEVHGNKIAFLKVTEEHNTLEKVSHRLLWLFGLSEIALLLMAMALTRANMRPIIRSWKQQRTFVADAAHEFKTPMTVIQNDLERMLEHPNDTVMDQVENVAGALTEVRHLNNLIGDMLTLAQSDAAVPMFVYQDMDLAAVAREVGDIFKYPAEEREQSLVIDMPETLPIQGDAQRIRQLLVILVDNAQKYAGPDATVTVAGKRKGGTIRLVVSDTGKGVNDEQKKRLFDRFYRVDKARSRSTGGHGLGLSIAKWVVQGHHGSINVVDTVPHGVTFQIVLPRAQKNVTKTDGDRR